MRDLLIIISMCVAAVVVGAWLYFYGPSDYVIEQPQTPASTEPVQAEETTAKHNEISFGVLGHGSVAEGVSERKNYAIYSKEEYARIWKLTGTTEKMPTIDFKKGYVIAVFAGTKPTGGYTISVDNITDVGNTRSVSVLMEKPGSGCITSQALTSPYQIVRVPFSPATITRIDVEKEVPCS